MGDDTNVEKYLFLAIGLLKGVSEMNADLFFSFFKLVQFLVILIELRVDSPLTVIKPNIEFLGGL